MQFRIFGENYPVDKLAETEELQPMDVTRNLTAQWGDCKADLFRLFNPELMGRLLKRSSIAREMHLD